ncbi:unnamed protein product [Cunninghamella echinulata]
MSLLDKLNNAQKLAVTYDTKALEILAPPGSGKTRVLTTRVAWLVKEKKIFPGSIVVVTFTNKAANEMKERLRQPYLLGPHLTEFVRMGTFHSFLHACYDVMSISLDWIKTFLLLIQP